MTQWKKKEKRREEGISCIYELQGEVDIEGISKG
jgi:hypothetical protein